MLTEQLLNTSKKQYKSGVPVCVTVFVIPTKYNTISQNYISALLPSRSRSIGNNSTIILVTFYVLLLYLTEIF